MRKISFSVLLILCAAALVFAGGGRDTRNNAQTAAQGERDIVVAIPAQPQHFTTFNERQSGDDDQYVLYNIYDTLMYFNTRTGAVEPWLAESWELSPDGLQLKVKVREDVTFHDGSKMTAEDVAFTYNTAKQYPIGRSMLINFDRAEVIDDYNLIIHMAQPFGAVLNLFCTRVAPIMSKAYFEKVGMNGYYNAPIGTGAYKFVRLNSGDSVVLERNENYWRGRPAFRTVTLKIIPDINTQMLALEAGDVDVVFAMPIENVLRINSPELSIDTTESNAVQFLFFNMQENKWAAQDMNFRKAVQYAIDKDAINAAVFGGRASLIDMYGSSAYSAKPPAGTYSSYTRDLAKARQYLAASNYDGRDFTIVCKAGTPTALTAEVIQGTLQEIGIKVRVLAVDSATFYDVIRGTGDFDAQLVINPSSIMDMDGLNNYFTTMKYELPGIKYPRGEEMDRLILTARVEPNPAKRLEYFKTVCSIINEDVYHIYTNVDINTVAFKSDLKNVRADMAKFYRFFEWSY